MTGRRVNENERPYENKAGQLADDLTVAVAASLQARVVEKDREKIVCFAATQPYET